ncbi:MAG: hypothetical protein COT43_00220 [Candidatus Marinimicrobia bacterium CG08_land_8_20_14_0_20_45_22]|nr:MAG: hypothetical protein COT43_00220 [Candidatus Marinimicrobia bacterium CG08_land_8_20_14_0_20_45_22]
MRNLILLVVYFIVAITVWLNYRNGGFRWNVENIRLDKFRFPRHFLWGASTSAYQVEGGTVQTDWNLWENSFDMDGIPRVKNGQTIGIAVDHLNRFRDDIRLLKSQGGNVYHFSVEWSRIEPASGQWNREALDHYLKMCEFLRQESITPIVSLHHFSSPIWFYERGGFENPDSVKRFTDYAYHVGESLGKYVDFWATIDEPSAYAMNGWLKGIYPPGQTDPSLCGRVLSNVLKAHSEAYYAIHDIDRSDADGDGIPCQVGLIQNVPIFDPARRWLITDWLAAWNKDQQANQSVINVLLTGKFTFRTAKGFSFREDYPRLENSVDWIGVNYTCEEECKFQWNHGLEIKSGASLMLPIADNGWTIYPAGLYRAIRTVSRLGVPIYITGNVVDSSDPVTRRRYLLEHIDAVNEAISDQYDVRGYLYGSLLDGFEWTEGYERKFGLFHVNRDTQERKLKEGNEIFSEIIAACEK